MTCCIVDTCKEVKTFLGLFFRLTTMRPESEAVLEGSMLITEENVWYGEENNFYVISRYEAASWIHFK